MDTYYSSERNVQILISLMKSHEIKKIIASPGTCNVPLIASLQNDPFFEIFSSVDERSAAYMACGLAAESGESVALSCTGATASRNYMPGLTEAFYRKLPVLAITSSNPNNCIGQLMPQVTDRRFPAPDVSKLSVTLPAVHESDDEWECNLLTNRALLELRHHGNGPVHINLITSHSRDFSVKQLPETRVIRRITLNDNFPDLGHGRIGIFVGAHSKWTQKLSIAVDNFCQRYDAVVLSDLTGNYKGKYGVLPNLVTDQTKYRTSCQNIRLLIHIGEVSGAYMTLFPEEVWRVSSDGELRDTFRKLQYVFEMDELTFFEHYVDSNDGSVEDNEVGSKSAPFAEQWQREYERIASKIPELPFSNGWIAQTTAKRLPENCVLHLGILNSLRMWNYYSVPSSVNVYCNTGGFGIDGCTSTLLGASLANKNCLYFGVIGDLAFFYDLNALGNRHVGRNLRILLINNGCGNEFHDFNSLATRAGIGDDIDSFIAAGGHFGSKSKDLVCHYAEALGFEYLTASSKQEYLQIVDRFVISELTEKPMLLEVFVDRDSDSSAHEIICDLESSITGSAKAAVKTILGDKGVQMAKKLVRH